MLVIDNGDAIRGKASVASKIDFTVNGYVGVTATQLADGQLGTGEADLYASSANATVVTSITLVNTDTSARTVDLYLKPSGGTARSIVPVTLSLGIGYSLYTDGQRFVVMNATGETIYAYPPHASDHTDGTDDIQESSTSQKGICQLDDTPVNGETNEPITSNWAYDHENILTTKGDLLSYSTALARLGVGTDTHVLTADSGETLGVKWAASAGGGSTVVWKDASEQALSDTDRSSSLTPTELDLTAYTSANAGMAILQLAMVLDSITGTASAYISVRKNGTTPDYAHTLRMGNTTGDIAGAVRYTEVIVGMDADEIIEYWITLAGTIQVDSYIRVLGYIE